MTEEEFTMESNGPKYFGRIKSKIPIDMKMRLGNAKFSALPLVQFLNSNKTEIGLLNWPLKNSLGI